MCVLKIILMVKNVHGACEKPFVFFIAGVIFCLPSTSGMNVPEFWFNTAYMFCVVFIFQ
jgi:hypothetical protein